MPLPCGTDSRSHSLGLWEHWKESKSQEWIRTFTILTTPQNEIVAPLHARMPLIHDYDQWLDTNCDPAPLIHPYPFDDMVTWQVSTRVNKPENDDPTILDRIEAVV